eukprot:2378588-Pyramimonas_sp.AAC.2
MSAVTCAVGTTLMAGAKAVRTHKHASPAAMHKPGQSSSTRRQVLGVGIATLTQTLCSLRYPSNGAANRIAKNAILFHTGLCVAAGSIPGALQATALDFTKGIESIELPEMQAPGAKMFAEWKGSIDLYYRAPYMRLDPLRRSPPLDLGPLLNGKVKAPGQKDERNAKDKARDDEFASSDYLKCVSKSILIGLDMIGIYTQDLLVKSEANKRQ